MTFSCQAYQDFDYGYATTVHKSQGKTVDHAFVYVGSRAWDRFLAYVSMTRHRHSLHVYADQKQFKDLEALDKVLSRAVLKDSVLDWPLSFVIRRGFDPEGLISRFIEKIAGIKQSIRDQWLFVTNYAAFKIHRAHQKMLLSKSQARDMAKKVALFVDLRNSLSANVRVMKQALKPNEQFYQHHNYHEWYEQTLLKNKLAFEVLAQYPLYKKALSLNCIHRSSLEKMASDHQHYCHVKSYLNHYQRGEQTLCQPIALEIHSDLEQHFSAIMFVTKRQGLNPKNIIRQIGLDAKMHQRLNPLKDSLVHEKRDNLLEKIIHDQSDSFADEWKRLKAIQSRVIDRVWMAKERLGQASQPLSIKIQTRGFERAIRSLCKQEKLLSRVKTVAPNLASAFEKINQSPKEMQIDWLSDEYTVEFDCLRHCKEKSIQYLVTCHDHLKNTKDTTTIKMITRRLETTTLNILRSKCKTKKLEQLAPKLVEKLQAFVKFKSKQKELERDL